MARVLRSTLGAIIATALALTSPNWATPAAARGAATPNAVVTWHIHAQTAIYDVGRQTPNAAARSFAMVQGAVFDAVNAIAGAPYQPYLMSPRSRRGDSVPAAVAASAYRVLVSLFPAQADALRARYDEELAKIPDGRAKRSGTAVGEATAAAMIADRTGDGAFDTSVTWPVSEVPGEYRLTPPGFVQSGAWYAFLKPFVVRDPTRYRVSGPPPLASAGYARQLNEVKSLGSATSTSRTPDQTEAAIWWDDFHMVEWEMRRVLATDQRLGNLATARLFAQTDIATVDALISCYQQKRHWNLWRPVTAIPLADTDGNPATTADPAWQPLRVTAPSPEWPSGHTCYTSATMVSFRAFFGRDRLPFHAYSPASGTTRHFDSFAKAQAEVQLARIWAGVHYRGATVLGDQLGTAATREVIRNFAPMKN
ncbi:vanadium-dependent haloperoxidase [Actinoplanes hulinensis]|uniref:Vanadium-dependent haloperoxidase n=1 Tax=Actinoplanes hulinensis TaxID=1144547 RepID=A0ABS7AVF3_9ACTN|nr:vanadium-dependent haloperoxidase [Actinoplanes hulinensis]MBW6432751.1 vanadium-dependent haloperoxidase [Actinoplanes hulinensis]